MKGGIVGVKRINEIITDKPQTDKKRKNVKKVKKLAIFQKMRKNDAILRKIVP